MVEIRGIVVAVGAWYGKTLEVCLVRNMRHLSECLVVTTPEDRDVQAVARAVPGVRVLETDAFTRHGADFNKGLGLEEGFEALGRRGWILVHDADILLPNQLPVARIEPGTLYGAKRRILEDPSRWCPGLDFRTCTPSQDGGPIGFFQLFHADDRFVKSKRPWYDVTFAHAGGGDAYFLEHWPHDRRVVLPIETLHLGPKDRNWFGTTAQAQAKMGKFVTDNGWFRAAQAWTPDQIRDVPEFGTRVQVPGYPDSGYELPFVRRAQAQKAKP